MSSFCLESYDSISQYFSNLISYLKDLVGWDINNVLEVDEDEDEVVFVRPLTPIPTTGILVEPDSLIEKPELYTIPENKRLVYKDHTIVNIPDLSWDNNIKWVEESEKIKVD